MKVQNNDKETSTIYETVIITQTIRGIQNKNRNYSKHYHIFLVQKHYKTFNPGRDPQMNHFFRWTKGLVIEEIELQCVLWDPLVRSIIFAGRKGFLYESNPLRAWIADEMVEVSLRGH